MARKTRYTVFDMLDEKGEFEKNPANAISPQYTGPVEFPKMLYHPEGKRRVTVPEQKVATPIGVTTIPAQYEMIYTIAKDKEEEKVLVGKGWHLHPSKAMQAAGDEVLPPAPPPEDADALEQQIREMTARLAQARKEAQKAV